MRASRLGPSQPPVRPSRPPARRPRRASSGHRRRRCRQGPLRCPRRPVGGRTRRWSWCRLRRSPLPSASMLPPAAPGQGLPHAAAARWFGGTRSARGGAPSALSWEATSHRPRRPRSSLPTTGLGPDPLARERRSTSRRGPARPERTSKAQVCVQLAPPRRRRQRCRRHPRRVALVCGACRSRLPALLASLSVQTTGIPRKLTCRPRLRSSLPVLPRT
mmetsp:Transcript_54740/g.177866  ORF Transcript_54740/g.177866 Transcript_54740/m.177866 type:complete len:218 (+) Transcript_54740:1367-2020(+)